MTDAEMASIRARLQKLQDDAAWYREQQNPTYLCPDCGHRVYFSGQERHKADGGCQLLQADTEATKAAWADYYSRAPQFRGGD